MNDQPARKTFFGGCPHDCPDTCAMIHEVEDGKLVEVRGNKDHPMTRGTLCVKLKDYHDHHYNPDGVIYPLRRSGPKGSRQFTRISWDEAIADIISRWKDIIAKFGSQAIMPYSYLGNEGLVQGLTAGDALFNKLGSREDVLRVGFLYRLAAHSGTDRWRRSGKLRPLKIYRHLGLQFDLDQFAPLALRARGPEARR
jgi:anaerobic selenocysteine-containing dehydrogenase